MPTLNRFHTLLWFSAVLFFCGAGSADPAPSANDLLATLKAHDARFDNFRLNYRRPEIFTLSRPEWSGINGGEPDPSWSNPEIENYVGKTREITRHVAAIVRRPDVTFISELDPADVAYFKTVPNGIGIPAPYSFTSNIGRKLRDYMPDPSGGGLMEMPGRPEILEEGLMEIEMALGIGFGRRLTEITSVTETEQGWDVTGTMKMYSTDTSTAALSIDRNYVVRSARIEWLLPQGSYTTLINTAGTAYAGGFALAESGSFKQTIHPGEALKQPDSVRADLRVVFDSYRGDLTDAEYAAKTRSLTTAVATP